MFYSYLYWGKCPLGHIRPPPFAKSLHKLFFSKFFILFFYFRCILLQISHQKCFFISTSILGRSGVNTWRKINISHEMFLYLFPLIVIF